MAKVEIGKLALLETFLRHDADREVWHRLLRDDGIDGVSKRRPSLAANAPDPVRNHVTIAPDADIELGFVIVDDTFNSHFSPGHVESAFFVDDVNCQQSALLLRFSYRRERAREREQHADLDLVRFIRTSSTESQSAAEYGSRQQSP